MYTKQMKTIVPIPVSDADVVEGMRILPGYLDITVDDFKELYRAIYSLASKRILQTVTAVAIMQYPVQCVSEKSTLKEIVAFLGEHGISGAPVVDNSGKVVGIISEKDILRHIGLEGLTRSIQLVAHDACLPEIFEEHKAKILAGEVMTRSVLTVFEHSSLAEVLELFRTRSINRIPVVDTDYTPLGIITRNDVIEAFSTIHL